MDSVNPLYYVTFTTFTLLASFILFRGFNTTDTVNTISLLCGFLTIFTGVYLLNLSREDPNGENLGMKLKDADGRGGYGEVGGVDGIPVDGVAGLGTRMSMQARRSGSLDIERHRRSNSWSLRSPITGNHPYSRSNDQQHLMHSYDMEANALSELAEDSDEDSGSSNRKRTSFEDANGERGVMNGDAGGSGFGPPRRAKTVETPNHKNFDHTQR